MVLGEGEGEGSEGRGKVEGSVEREGVRWERGMEWSGWGRVVD